MISGLGDGGWEPGRGLEDRMRTAKPGVGWEARLGREGREGPGPRPHGVKGVKDCGRDKAHRFMRNLDPKVRFFRWGTTFRDDSSCVLGLQNFP